MFMPGTFGFDLLVVPLGHFSQYEQRPDRPRLPYAPLDDRRGLAVTVGETESLIAAPPNGLDPKDGRQLLAVPPLPPTDPE